MASRTLYNAALLINGRNLAVTLLAVPARLLANAIPCGTMGDSVRKYVNGPPHAELAIEGYAEWGTGLVGTVLLACTGIASADAVTTVAERLGVGEEAFVLKHRQEALEHGAAWGEPNAFRMSAKNANRLIPGTQLYAGQVSGGSGNGTAYQLGAVAAGQTLYALLHVYAMTSTSLTIKLQRDTVGFGSPTDHHTFGVVSAVGASEWREDATVTTDDYWRMTWSQSGGGLTADVSLVVGIV